MFESATSLATIAAARRFLRAVGDGALDLVSAFTEARGCIELHYGPPLPFTGPLVTRDDIQQHCLELNRYVHIRENKWTIFLCQGETFITYGYSSFEGAEGGATCDAGACSWLRFVNGQLRSGHSYYDSAVLQHLLSRGSSGTESVDGNFSRALGSMLNLSGELFGPPSEDFSEILALLTGNRNWRARLLGRLEARVQWFAPSPDGEVDARLCQDELAVQVLFEELEAAYSCTPLRILEQVQAEDTLALRAELLVSSHGNGVSEVIPFFLALTLRDGRLVRGYEVCDTLRLRGLLGPPPTRPGGSGLAERRD